MSVRSGLVGQLMVGEEVTYGTRVAPTRGYEFASESLEFDIARLEAFGVRAAGAAAGSVQRTDRWAAGRKTVSGSVDFDGDETGVGDRGFGILYKHMMGAAPTISTPTGGTLTRDHVYIFADPFGLGLTMQVGIPGTGGVIDVHEYEGCKVTSFEFSQELDKWLALSVEVDGEDKTVSQSLASFSLPSSQSLFHWGQASYTVAGGALSVIGFKVKVETPMAVDRHRQSATPYVKSEPIINGPRVIEGELEIEYAGLVEYNRYLNSTVASVVGTWLGTTAIEGAFFPRLILTMNDCRFDKPSGPNVQGPDLVTFTAPFKAMYDGTDQPFQIETRNADTAV